MSGFQSFELYSAAGVEDSYEVLGDDMQFVNVKLAEGQMLTVEPGSMSFMAENMKSEVNCANPLMRCCGGNCCIMSGYAPSGGDGYIALSPRIPAKILTVDPTKYNGGSLLNKSGSYLGSIGDTELSYNCDFNPLTCCFGGQGCVRQQVRGKDGAAFLFGMGTIMTKTLAEGEVVVVDTNSLLAWQDTVSLGVQLAGAPCTCCFGGEGLCNTKVTGPGEVYLQSFSREKFQMLLASVTSGAGADEGPGAAGDGGAPSDSAKMDR